MLLFLDLLILVIGTFLLWWIRCSFLTILFPFLFWCNLFLVSTKSVYCDCLSWILFCFSRVKNYLLKVVLVFNILRPIPHIPSSGVSIWCWFPVLSENTAAHLHPRVPQPVLGQKYWGKNVTFLRCAMLLGLYGCWTCTHFLVIIP